MSPIYTNILFQLQLPETNYLGKIIIDTIRYSTEEYIQKNKPLQEGVDTFLLQYITTYFDACINFDDKTYKDFTKIFYKEKPEYKIKLFSKGLTETQIEPDIKFDIEIDEENSYAKVFGFEIHSWDFIPSIQSIVTNKNKLDIQTDYDELEPGEINPLMENLDDFLKENLENSNEKISLIKYLMSKFPNSDSNIQIYKLLRVKLLTQYCRQLKYTDKNYEKLKYNLVVKEVKVEYPDDKSHKYKISFEDTSGIIKGIGEIGKVECNYDDFHEYSNLYIKEIYNHDKDTCSKIINYLHQKYF